MSLWFASDRKDQKLQETEISKSVSIISGYKVRQVSKLQQRN